MEVSRHPAAVRLIVSASHLGGLVPRLVGFVDLILDSSPAIGLLSPFSGEPFQDAIVHVANLLQSAPQIIFGEAQVALNAFSKPKPKPFRASEPAALFDVTPQHIYKMAARGAIPSFRLGVRARCRS